MEILSAPLFIVGGKKKSPQWMLRRFVTGPIAGPEFCSEQAAVKLLEVLEHIVTRMSAEK